MLYHVRTNSQIVNGRRKGYEIQYGISRIKFCINNIKQT